MRYDVGRFRRPMRRSTEGQLASLVSLGDGSTLTLDFTTGVLDSRLSFTRSSTATYIDSSGYVASASIDAPRFDHDPSTLAPRGLLIEGQSVNLARYSETLETTGGYWGYNASTRTVDSTDVNPTGGTGSIYFGPTTNGGSRYCGLFLTGQPTTTRYTYSVWLKGKGTADCVISIQSSAGAQNATMTILSQPSGASASVSSTGGGFSKIINLSTTGWTKIQIVLSGNLGGTGTINVFMYPKETSGQTTADTLYAWGAQLEAGSGASSYIPTGASTATRNRDQVTITNLSSINFSQTEGTCLATVEVREKADSTFLPYGSFDTSGGGRCWWWLRHNLSTVSGTRLLGTAFNSGGSTGINTSNYVYNGGSGGVVKFATSLNTAASSMVFVISGGAPQTTTAAAFTLATAAQWGLNTSTDVTATALGSMWVQSFKYWPAALPNAQLQSLTL